MAASKTSLEPVFGLPGVSFRYQALRMKFEQVQTNHAFRRWLPFVWIVVASALAHLWCLRSQFYMDDMPAILDNDVVRNGSFLTATTTNLWTTFGYIVQYKMFGMSPVGFHAVNWLLHTAVACVLFGFGREFLRDRLPVGVAWFGALLFAVHPLASEIPNYARTQDLAWVTVFSLFASWAMLRWMRGGGWMCLLGVALGFTGAALSKGPGMFHAAMMVAAVGLAFMTAERAAWVRRRVWWIVAVFSGFFAVLWFSGVLGRFWSGTEHWNEPRFVGHAYTLARVFWEFAWRAAVPVSLCSDHQIAESLVPPGSGWLGIPDKEAMMAAAGMLVLTGVSLWLSWRPKTRLFGVCLFLFVATILFRVLYLIPEFMPEYRIYPGMPWFCLGAAIALFAVWRTLLGDVTPRTPAFVLLAVLAVMSAKRSFVWHDLDDLTADVRKQYPAQARALWELQDRDTRNGEWKKVIARQQKEWPPILKEFLEQNRSLAPARELPSGHFALADVGCKGRYVLAVAHVKGPAAGMMELQKMEAYMRQLRMEQKIHWSYFNGAKIRILTLAGNPKAALEILKVPKTPHNLTRSEIRSVEAQAQVEGR